MRLMSWFIELLFLIVLSEGRFLPPLISENKEDLEQIVSKETTDQLRVISNSKLENADSGISDLSLAEWSTYNAREPNGDGTYVFGYDNVVDSEGNEHYRSEERFHNGTVVGEYGYTDSEYNRIIKVSYIADEGGYRAKTEILPMEDMIQSKFTKTMHL